MAELEGARDLTTGSVPRHLIAFSLPMLAGSAIQTGYSVINRFWVGRYLSADALAAVTVSMPVLFVTIALAAGLTLGANILVSQRFGAKDWPGLRNAVQASAALIAIVAVALLALGLALARPLLVLMNTPPSIIGSANSYLHIMICTLPLTFAVFLLASTLRGIGDSKTPVYFQAWSLALNAALDPLLMFGWLGFPRLGLNGTAWASVVSQSAAVSALLIYIPRRRPLVMPDLRRPRIDRETAGLLARIGLPTMVQQSVVSVSMLFIVSFVNRFGADADAAFGAGLTVDGVAFVPAITFGMAVSTMAGQNIGAGRLERVRGVFWWGLAISGLISGLITVLAVGLPELVLRLFLRDAQVIGIGVSYLRIVGFTYVLYAVLFVSNGVINGSGHTLATTLMTAASLWGIRLPLAALLPHHLGGVRGIWYAMLSSVACGMVMSLGYYASGRWRRSAVHRAVPLSARGEAPDVEQVE
ncbi:MAG: MATE family efflux transporter [Armatimonadota bacterium]